MIVIIDNYDSFTYNLVQRIGEIDRTMEVRVFRNDKVSVDEIDSMGPGKIIVSPGPCTPLQAGISNDVIKHFAPKVPILGVCLGHQCIGYSFGAKVVRAERIMHGKTSEIEHDGRGIYEGVGNPFTATRYHSLTVEKATLPDCLEVASWSADRKELMGIRHKKYRVEGVQFHPESFLTKTGYQLLSNFIKIKG